MRLITRSDFDGLVCGALLKEADVIDSFKFAHPKDLQDGLIAVTEDDCLANVPYVPGCGLWFDHHSSEMERNAFRGRYVGVSKRSPSAAHVVYDYYGGARNFPRFGDMLAAVDKLDSADLTVDEILHPERDPWILLGFIMDPRTGLGRFHDYTISNYQLMEKLVDCCRTMTIDEIIALPDVQERAKLYFEQTALFTEMVKQHTVQDGNIIFSDLRGVETIYTGNRFMIYSLYPTANLSVWVVSGKGGHGCSAAVGHSVVDRSSKLDVGALMLKYGGGGHTAVGTCQFSNEDMDEKLPELMSEIKRLNG